MTIGLRTCGGRRSLALQHRTIRCRLRQNLDRILERGRTMIRRTTIAGCFCAAFALTACAADEETGTIWVDDGGASTGDGSKGDAVAADSEAATTSETGADAAVPETDA